MPGLFNTASQNTRTAPQDMTMNDSYERLSLFMDRHDTTAQYFTIDDDHYGVGVLCAHQQDQQDRAATTVRLDKDQIRHFMTTHGYQVRPNLAEDSQHNPTFTPNGFICTKPQ
ncbi:hypothetical protein [Absidia glauca]|uniref:Uncharacterized protein n=1 Tax=Absidia glauca TaxID=4829 RepID=A0A163IYW3_ABSGL|nr:hypothetical protein [Absidia glauca]